MQKMIKAIAALLVLAIIAGGIGWLSDGFKNWNVKEWFNPDQFSDVFDRNGNALDGSSTHNLPSGIVFAACTANSVSNPDGIRIRATVEPSDATIQALDWQLSWANADQGLTPDLVNPDWNTGSVTEYMQLAIDNNMLSATVKCLQPFGRPIAITVSDRVNPKTSAQCIVDYSYEIRSIDKIELTGWTEKYSNQDPYDKIPGSDIIVHNNVLISANSTPTVTLYGWDPDESLDYEIEYAESGKIHFDISAGTYFNTAKLSVNTQGDYSIAKIIAQPFDGTYFHTYLDMTESKRGIYIDKTAVRDLLFQKEYSYNSPVDWIDFLHLSDFQSELRAYKDHYDVESGFRYYYDNHKPMPFCIQIELFGHVQRFQILVDNYTDLDPIRSIGLDSNSVLLGD